MKRDELERKAIAFSTKYGMGTEAVEGESTLSMFMRATNAAYRAGFEAALQYAQEELELCFGHDSVGDRVLRDIDVYDVCCVEE